MHDDDTESDHPGGGEPAPGQRLAEIIDADQGGEDHTGFPEGGDRADDPGSPSAAVMVAWESLGRRLHLHARYPASQLHNIVELD